MITSADKEWTDKRKRPHFIDIVGQKYGRLTVMRMSGYNKHGHTVWDCKCECGKWVPSLAKCSLATGNTRSCGCLERELTRSRNFRHGKTNTQMYKTYHNMLTRCTNPHIANYRLYGGKGIRCEWKTFEEFEKDMGVEFHSKWKGKGSISIERIDNNKNYCKENCRWATPTEQANNTNRNHYLTFQGKTQTLTQWAREKGSTQECIRARLKLGFTVEEALLLPKKAQRI